MGRTMQSFGHSEYIPVSTFESARPGSVRTSALTLWSELEFLQQALRWTLSLMQGPGLQGAVGCVALEDAEAGLCVWAVGGDVTAGPGEAGSLGGSAVIGYVGAPVCTGLQA